MIPKQHKVLFLILGSYTFVCCLIVIFFMVSKNNTHNKPNVFSLPPSDWLHVLAFPELTNPPMEALPDIVPKEKVVQERFVQMQEALNNHDIVGYLKIDGTTVDYPVVQSSDNEYYLNKGLDGAYDIAGSVFLDLENNIKVKDRNTVIYGHNMNKDYMFHALRYYKDKDFYEKHKYITFDTLYENQTWEVFAFYKTDVNFEYIRVFFADDNHFMNMVNEMNRRSLYDTGVEVTEKDRILTLSTCSNQEEDTRWVLNAKLVVPSSSQPGKN